LVVCQVRFEEQSQVAEAGLGRQFLEAVATEYPTPTQLRAEQLKLGLGLGSADFSTATKKGWRAASADSAWNVTLLPDSVGIETSAYTEFSDLQIRLRSLLAIVQDLVAPALSERIGLRFVNTIPLPASKRGTEAQVLASAPEWAELLSAEFQGPAQRSELATGLQSFDARALFDAGDGVRALVHWAFGGTDRLLIDIDAFRDAPEVFATDRLLSQAERCDDVCLQLFQNAVAAATLNRLRKRPSR